MRREIKNLKIIENQLFPSISDFFARDLGWPLRPRSRAKNPRASQICFVCMVTKSG